MANKRVRVKAVRKIKTYVYQDKNVFVFQPGDDFLEWLEENDVPCHLIRLENATKLRVSFECPVCHEPIIVVEVVEGWLDCAGHLIDGPRTCYGCLYPGHDDLEEGW